MSSEASQIMEHTVCDRAMNILIDKQRQPTGQPPVAAFKSTTCYSDTWRMTAKTCYYHWNYKFLLNARSRYRVSLALGTTCIHRLSVPQRERWLPGLWRWVPARNDQSEAVRLESNHIRKQARFFFFGSMCLSTYFKQASSSEQKYRMQRTILSSVIQVLTLWHQTLGTAHFLSWVYGYHLS